MVDEWETISQDNILELPSHEAVDDLAYRIIEYEPQGDKELIIYAEMLGGINEMLDYRRERLHLGVDGVGPVTWIVVAMGALITIGMAWFYNTRSARAHYYLVGMMSLMFGLMIFLIIAMDHPLLGQFSVDNSPFLEVKEDIAIWNTEFHGAWNFRNSNFTDRWIR